MIAGLPHEEATYRPNKGGKVIGALGSLFKLSSQQIPRGQLSALLWASYFVGMEAPGQQAMFAGFEFAFALPPVENPGITLRGMASVFEPRFKRLKMSGHGDGIKHFQLTAFRRPDRVVYSMESIKNALASSPPSFDGKVVFVSGGSRGFGSVLARSFALQGADIAVNYRSHDDDARIVEEEILRQGRQILLVKGDLSQESDCGRMAEEVRARYGHVDILVHNAFPAVPARQFFEWAPSELTSFVVHAVQMCAQLCHHFIAVMKDGGMIVNISSLYVRQPPSGFTHYVTAKSAVDGFIKCLAQEQRHLNFVTVRAPRMLTDQTNNIFDLSPPNMSAIPVSKSLLALLGTIPPDGNYQELDL